MGCSLKHLFQYVSDILSKIPWFVSIYVYLTSKNGRQFNLVMYPLVELHCIWSVRLSIEPETKWNIDDLSIQQFAAILYCSFYPCNSYYYFLQFRLNDSVHRLGWDAFLSVFEIWLKFSMMRLTKTFLLFSEIVGLHHFYSKPASGDIDEASVY